MLHFCSKCFKFGEQRSQARAVGVGYSSWTGFRLSEVADPVVSSSQTGPSLLVEAKVDSTVEERQRKLIEVFGIIGGLITE